MAENDIFLWVHFTNLLTPEDVDQLHLLLESVNELLDLFLLQMKLLQTVFSNSDELILQLLHDAVVKVLEIDLQRLLIDLQHQIWKETLKWNQEIWIFLKPSICPFNFSSFLFLNSGTRAHDFVMLQPADHYYATYKCGLRHMYI